MAGLRKFFEFSLQNIPRELPIVPFQIFIYNPQNQTHEIACHANSPLTDNHFIKLENSLKEGKKLVISQRQKEIFLNITQTTENVLKEIEAPLISQESPQLNLKNSLESPYEELRLPIISDVIPSPNETSMLAENISLVKESENGPQPDNAITADVLSKNESQSLLIQTFYQTLENDDFLKLINLVKIEILGFDQYISPATSIAREFAGILLNEDNINNKIVCLCYTWAKIAKIDNEVDLGDLISACFLHHIGFSQMEIYFSLRPYNDLSVKDRERYDQHPGLVQHLIRKNEINIGKRSLNIILDHHERANGSGRPQGKKEAFIDPLAFILGAASHVIEYSQGKITGRKMSVKSVLNLIKNKTPTPGLDLEFGSIIEDIIAG